MILKDKMVLTSLKLPRSVEKKMIKKARERNVVSIRVYLKQKNKKKQTVSLRSQVKAPVSRNMDSQKYSPQIPKSKALVPEDIDS
jgi:hypothetical protein